MNNYIYIYDYIINTLVNLDNFENIINIESFDCAWATNELKKFYKENNIINKIKTILNSYDNKINTMTIIYNKNDNNKIFGDNFVNKNKGKCYLFIN
jgi:hypothetical protein